MKHQSLIKKALAFACAVTLTATAAAAAALPGADLATLSGTTVERTLTRQAADGYNYYAYDDTALPTGFMGGLVRDVDGDGTEEYLLVRMAEENEARLEIYEPDGDGWTLASDAHLFTASLDSAIEAHDVFLKQLDGRWVIFCENWQHEDLIADGAGWFLSAYAYENGALSPLGEDLCVDGTDLGGDLNEWRTEDYYRDYRPECRAYAATLLDDYQLNIKHVYWDQMIAEQDDSLDVICRLYSWYTPGPDKYDIYGRGEKTVSGFYTTFVDCTMSGLRIPAEHQIAARYADPAIDETAAAGESSDDSGEYIIADSNTRALTAEELSQYDKDTLALIRNEILARYGYPFQKQVYRDYFGSKSWYVRNEGFTYGMLSSLEMENVELIKKLEDK